MARQRCFLSAMADQLDPVHVLRNFGSLAKTIETNVHTDIPLNRLPSLVRLVSSVDSQQDADGHVRLRLLLRPAEVAATTRSRDSAASAATVRQAILTPELLKRAGKAKTAKQSC